MFITVLSKIKSLIFTLEVVKISTFLVFNQPNLECGTLYRTNNQVYSGSKWHVKIRKMRNSSTLKETQTKFNEQSSFTSLFYWRIIYIVKKMRKFWA